MCLGLLSHTDLIFLCLGFVLASEKFIFASDCFLPRIWFFSYLDYSYAPDLIFTPSLIVPGICTHYPQGYTRRCSRRFASRHSLRRDACGQHPGRQSSAPSVTAGWFACVGLGELCPDAKAWLTPRDGGRTQGGTLGGGGGPGIFRPGRRDPRTLW